MSSIGRGIRDGEPDAGTARPHPARDPGLAIATDGSLGRDRFRAAVTGLEPGPLRDVLTAVAYARDEAARVGTAGAPSGRWLAVVAAAERAVHQGAADAARLRWAAA
jgi:hypothetical protein